MLRKILSVIIFHFIFGCLYSLLLESGWGENSFVSFWKEWIDCGPLSVRDSGSDAGPSQRALPDLNRPPFDPVSLAKLEETDRLLQEARAELRVWEDRLQEAETQWREAELERRRQQVEFLRRRAEFLQRAQYEMDRRRGR